MKLVYQPLKSHSHSHNTPNFFNEGETLEAFSISPKQKLRTLYFGGSSESVTYTTSYFIDTFPSHSMYLMSYRGYGGRFGKPSERTLFFDILAAYDKLSISHKAVSLIGYSLDPGVTVLTQGLPYI